MDKSVIFLDHEDFEKISEDELNYSTMQIHKQDHFEFKARMFAYKWSLLNNKSKEKLVPYSVKPDESAPHNWKSYLVLLMNPNENVLKKICFPSELYENFALVTKFDKSCSKKIEKFYKYKILDDDESKNKINFEEKKEELNDKFNNQKEESIPKNKNIVREKENDQINQKKLKNKQDDDNQNLRGDHKKKKSKKQKKSKKTKSKKQN